MRAGRSDRAHAEPIAQLCDRLRQIAGEASLSDGADLLGANHYVTSERWIDTDMHAWPARSHGGNARTLGAK